MKKIVTYALLVVIGVAMIGGIGCAAMSDYLTPAVLDSRAIDYVVDAGVADANDYGGYANLYKARMLEIDVKSAHEMNTLYYMQLLDKEALDFSILNGVVERNRAEAVALEDSIFNPTSGLLALGLGAFGIAGGGILGLMRKRPGDWEPAEVEDALTDLTVQMGDKERQFVETVKGIQKFMDNNIDPTNGDRTPEEYLIHKLKEELRSAQSADTKKAVAVAKTA